VLLHRGLPGCRSRRLTYRVPVLRTAPAFSRVPQLNLGHGPATSRAVAGKRRVLDLGCGTGAPTARQLVDGGCEVTGVDISPLMLDQARRNVPEATFLHRDIIDADAAIGHFDAVVAFFSLLMLPRDRIIEVLKGLHDMITPGGWLAIGMVEADLDDVPLPFLGAALRVSGWPRDQLKQVVTDAGFAIELEDVRSYAPPTPEVPPETQLFVLARRT
jgi:SAM-dependent methyltransferase